MVGVDEKKRNVKILFFKKPSPCASPCASRALAHPVSGAVDAEMFDEFRAKASDFKGESER